MKIFLSYASEDKDTAEQLYLYLIRHRHKVFFDRADLPEGGDFNSRIQKAINKCELFIFLISPDSVTKTSYAITELNFAREKWPHPEGHVLPVIIRETDFHQIPPYLRAVVILEPEGNTIAEVGRRVNSWRPDRNRKLLVALIALAVLVSFAAGIGIYNRYFNLKHPEEVGTSLSVLDPGFIKFRGNLNRDQVIDPLRQHLKSLGLNTPEASRDPTLTQSSIEYYDMSHQDEAQRLAQVINQYLTSKGYTFEFKVNYSSSPSRPTGAKVVISLYLQ